MIELILAGFLGLGLPPASPTEVAAKKCDYTSSAVGCSTNYGGGRESNVRADSRGSKGGQGPGKGKK